MQAALQSPPQIAGLFLAATAHLLPVSPKLFELLANDTESLSAFSSFAVRRAFSPSTPRTIVEKWLSQPILVNRLTAYADFKACNEFDISSKLEDLAALNIPTRILWGADESMVPRDRVETLALKLTQGNFHILQNTGHMLFQEAPEETTTLVLDFLLSTG